MRIWGAKSFIPFELEVLTPVHIGSGADFTPLEYAIQETGPGNYEIWLIDTAAWLGKYAADPKVGRALEDGEMATLRNLLNGCPDLAAFCLTRIPVRSASLGKTLMQKRNSIENKAEIMGFARNPFTHTPYIPASSIKGAISTALTDYLNTGRNPGLTQAKTPRDYRTRMDEMYGKIGEHAMQALRLADIALGPGLTSISEAIGEDLVPGKRLEKTPCETLDQQTRVYGNMRFALCDGKPAIQLPGKERVTVEKLAEICNTFYQSRYQAEMEKFYARPHLQEIGKALAPVSERIKNLDRDNEILLRVGRYSHFECVTVSGGQRPHPVKGPGLSRTLAGHRLPFGWIILKRASMEAYQKGIAAVDAALAADIERRTTLASEIIERKEAAAKRAAAEAETARLREEELAAMPPLEREVWMLEQPDSIENQASAIYAKLGEFGDLEKRAAEALMHFWQRAGKWEGRQLTKKQKEKVAAVKKILGL